MINYSGYIEAEVNDEDFAILQGGSVPESLGELKENQYIIAKDRFGKCGYFQFKDNKVKQVLYTELGNDYTGKIKPLNDQQVCAFHMLKDKDVPVKLITGKFGTGKAQPVDTMVPTPMGAKRLGDIEVGDYLFARDGRKTKVLGVFPQGVLTNYRVELSDGRIAFCNDEHIWTCIDKDGNFFDTTIKEIINSCTHLQAGRGPGRGRRHRPGGPAQGLPRDPGRGGRHLRLRQDGLPRLLLRHRRGCRRASGPDPPAGHPH